MTVQYSVYFFLLVSVVSLFVAFLFTREVIGSNVGTPEMQKIAGAIKECAKAFLRRHYKNVVVLLGMLLPTLAYAQPEHAGGGSHEVSFGPASRGGPGPRAGQLSEGQVRPYLPACRRGNTIGPWTLGI